MCWQRLTRNAAGTSAIGRLAIRAARAIAAPMKILPCFVAGLALLLSVPANAIVGGGAPSTEGVARSVVTIVGSRGNFCTGALIAPKLVLTVMHCVPPGADYKIVEYGRTDSHRCRMSRGSPFIPASICRPCQAHRATADVALLQLARRQGQDAGRARMPNIPINVGSRFTIAGIGVTVRGDGKSAARSASPVWSRPAGRARCRSVWSIPWAGARARVGACTGDSGGPVFEDKEGGPVIVGVVSWSTGPRQRGLRRHDGGHAADAIATGYCRRRRSGARVVAFPSLRGAD